jgi:hypothetical protein
VDWFEAAEFGPPEEALRFRLAPSTAVWPNNDAPIYCIAQTKAPWEEFSIGDRVTIRAFVTLDRIRGIRVTPYVLVSTSGGPMPIHPAEELAGRYDRDPEEFTLEMNRTWQLVRGKVLRTGVKEMRGLQRVAMILAGSDQTEVAVSVRLLRPKWIQAGDEVLLLGRVDVAGPFGIETKHKLGLEFASCLTPPRE